MRRPDGPPPAARLPAVAFWMPPMPLLCLLILTATTAGWGTGAADAAPPLPPADPGCELRPARPFSLAMCSCCLLSIGV